MGSPALRSRLLIIVFTRLFCVLSCQSFVHDFSSRSFFCLWCCECLRVLFYLFLFRYFLSSRSVLYYMYMYVNLDNVECSRASTVCSSIQARVISHIKISKNCFEFYLADDKVVA